MFNSLNIIVISSAIFIIILFVGFGWAMWKIYHADPYGSVAGSAFQGIIMTIAGTFGKSFLLNLVVKLGDTNLNVKIGDPSIDNWQGIIIIAILSVMAGLMMTYKYLLDKNV